MPACPPRNGESESTGPRRRRRRRRGHRGASDGFTLIELLLVVALLSVLSMLAVPRFSDADKSAKIEVDNANIAFIDMQWESKRVVNGAYGSLSALLADTKYFPDGPPVCPFGTAYADADGNNRVDPHGH